MNVMIGGKSAIDLEAIKVEDWADATEFLRHYGFDPEIPEDARYIHSVFAESLNFIATRLMPKEWQRGLRPPDEIIATTDMRHILLWAANSCPERESYQAWSCALLRVMHTIAHIEGIRRHVDLDAARDQIMGRLDRYVYKDPKGQLRFGKEGLSIPLHKVEWKKQKRRDSIIIKLLHKQGNVAETIFDLLGVRIVTERLSDVMVAVKLLRDLYMITFPNCNPGRARNTLIDTDHFRVNTDILVSMLKEGRINTLEFTNLVERVVQPLDKLENRLNPHSGAGYRSVQLTCRQLITGTRHEHQWHRYLSEFVQTAQINAETHNLLQQILEYSQSFLRRYDHRGHGYFPFEIHILDRSTYEANKQGDANHNRYKSSQIRAARRRVLAKVLTFKPTKKTQTNPN